MIFKYIPYGKFIRMLKIISHNGGIFKSLDKIWLTDTIKEGRYVGCDEFGNKYYENSYYMLGRSRWVEFNPAVRWNYDASQVAAEWFGWLHYKTDRLPGEDCAKFDLMNCCWAKQWLLPYQENMTGTDKAYYPYSTTRPHIDVWDGRSTCEKPNCPPKRSGSLK